jgi:hypothetical protein
MVILRELQLAALLTTLALTGCTWRSSVGTSPPSPAPAAHSSNTVVLGSGVHKVVYRIGPVAPKPGAHFVPPPPVSIPFRPTQPGLYGPGIPVNMTHERYTNSFGASYPPNIDVTVDAGAFRRSPTQGFIDVEYFGQAAGHLYVGPVGAGSLKIDSWERFESSYRLSVEAQNGQKFQFEVPPPHVNLPASTTGGLIEEQTCMQCATH